MTYRTTVAIGTIVGEAYGSPLLSAMVDLAFQGTIPCMLYIFEGATKLSHFT